MFAFGCWAGIKMFLHEKGACQNDMKTVSLQGIAGSQKLEFMFSKLSGFH